MNLQENIQRIKQMMGLLIEGLHDTYWQNEDGDKITLIDLLDATQDIPVEEFSVEELKPHLLTWDGNKDEVKKIESADLQYPILIFVNNDGEFISIIDGHHRAQKAVRKGLETIKAKVIPINYLPENIKKVFKHLNKNNSRLIFDIQKLVDDGIIFVTDPGDGLGGVTKPNWEGDCSVITLLNLTDEELELNPWRKEAINRPFPECIPYVQKRQYRWDEEKYQQVIDSIGMKGGEIDNYTI